MGTVVNFVAVKTSRFNRLQQPENMLILNLKELQDGVPGRPPGPEPEPILVELCGNLLTISD